MGPTGSPALGGLAEDVAAAAVESIAFDSDGRRRVIFHSCCSWTGWGVFREAGFAASMAGTGSVWTFRGTFTLQALTFRLSIRSTFFCATRNFSSTFCFTQKETSSLLCPPQTPFGRVVHFFFSRITFFSGSCFALPCMHFKH